MVVTFNSNKLFYDEWAYKIRLKMPTGYNQYIKTLLRYTKDQTVEKKLKSSGIDSKLYEFSHLSKFDILTLVENDINTLKSEISEIRTVLDVIVNKLNN